MQIVALLNTKKKGLNNISNPRTQNLEDLTTEGKVFIEFYNYIYKLCHGNNYEVIFQQFGIDDPVIINTISKNLSALAQEGVLRFPMNELIISNPTVQLFYNFLKKLMTPEDEKIRRRFKRIIPPERIIRLADMVYSLTSVSQFNNSKSLF